MIPKFQTKRRSVRLSGLLALLLALLFALPTIAQRHQPDSGQGKHRGALHLSSEQKTKIQGLKTKIQKEVLPLKNQVGEKEARLRTLETAEKTDLTAIHTTIDEIHALRAKMDRLRATNKQEIRKLLTEEQRLNFDTRDRSRGEGRKHGKT